MLCRDLPTLAASYRGFFDYWYAQEARLGAATLEIRYETLVADLETQLRALMEFLELPWDPAMLSPAARARARGFISTPSYTQVIQPVTSQAIGRWRNYEAAPARGDADARAVPRALELSEAPSRVPLRRRAVRRRPS